MIARRLRARGQQGASLLELLLAVVASAIVLLPTLAWAVLALDQQPRTEDGLTRSASTGLLGAYLPEDVAVAGAAAVADAAPADPESIPVNFEDCIGGEGQGGRVVLALLVSGDPVRRVLYAEAPSDDGTGVSVWRRDCGPDGTGTRSVEVFDDVAAGSTRAACDDGTDDGDCRQIEFVTRARSGGVPALLTATRRADTASLRIDRTGNRLPVAKVTVVAQGAGLPTSVSLTAAGSFDPDGNTLTYEWTFPTLPDGAPGAPAAQTVTGDQTTLDQVQIRSLTQLGRYYVTLTVTDADGASSTTYKRITADPQPPTAVASVSPSQGIAGETEFRFVGSTSTDPDGTITSWTWRLGGEEALGGVSYVRTEADWSLVIPAYVTGLIPVALTVTDSDGRSDSFVTSILVNPPGPPPTLPPDPDDPAPPVTVPGGPSPAFTATPGAGRLVAFDASATTDDGSVVGYDWDFGDGASSTGVTTSHTFPGPGSYVVRLTVTDDSGLTGSTTRTVNLPGSPSPPVAPTQRAFDMVWPAVPGVRRYLVDFEFTGNGCARSITDQAVGVGPDPMKAIPPNLCAGTATARGRYAVDVNGELAWSPWITVSTPAAGDPGTGEVVK